jgi:hypothetical protein
MRIRFQADADPNQTIVAAVFRLVTSDRQTMARFFGEFILKTESPGVVVARQRLSVGEVLEDLALIWTVSQAEEWTDHIVYLPL